jgi:malonyl CoA-acyl carrier protein transacylase
MADPSPSSSAHAVRAHIRELGKMAEVVGALCKEFERQPRVEVLATLKERVARLCEEWAKAEAILSGK